MNRIFITASPRQNVLPREGKMPTPYQAMDNPRLMDEESFSFPVINIMNGYVEEGDQVKLLIIVARYDWCEKNYEILKTHAEQLCTEKKTDSCEVIRIDVEFSEDSENHLRIFEELVKNIHDGDRLCACITYGSKPTPLLEIMALNYGYRTCKNVSIDCIAYGEMDHLTNSKSIFDVTELFYMDQIVNELGINKHNDPLTVIKSLIS